MSKEELQNINGGSVSATLINSLARGITALFDLGQAFGSAIRRIKDGKICPL